MAHALDKRVVAEGVETAEQAAFLRELGCDELQGYFLGEAVARAGARRVPGARRRHARADPGEGTSGRRRMSFWARVAATLRRWFGREPAPAFYVDGHAGLLPARGYRLYVPKGASRWRRMPAIVLLHGCKQTPDDIVKGTRFEALADRMGAYVLLPKQSQSANPYGCWNWFDGATASGRGEAAIVASMMHKALRWRRTDDGAHGGGGLSRGGALAAILGVHHGDGCARS
jgi:hypothetical protein